MRLAPLTSSIAALLFCISASALVAGCDDGHGHGHDEDGHSHADETGGHNPVPTGASCPEDSQLTYESFAQAFFEANCEGCHSEALTGADRAGAPEGMDFDTRELIAPHSDEIDSHAGAHGSVVNEIMPPASADHMVTVSERESLAEWLACGAP